MAYRLVQSLSREATINIDGHPWPDPCVVEDDDGIRLMLVGEGDIETRNWTEAHAIGAMAIIRVHADGTYDASLAETVIEHRVEVGRTMEPTWDALAFYGATPPRYAEVAGWSRVYVNDEGVLDNRFVHLHAHSHYSALDGYSTIPEMIQAVQADNQEALAITDHGVCAGHPELQTLATKAGIKPVFGIEANFVHDRFVRENQFDYMHLILWAQNNKGLRNLWTMSTEANTGDAYYGRPRMDWDVLERNAEGVMCSTACIRGPVARSLTHPDGPREDEARANLARLQGIFGDKLWVELHTNETKEQQIVNTILAQFAQEMGLPTIVVVDSHYPCFEDQRTHHIWIAAQTRKELTSEQDLFSGDQHFHLMTKDEVYKALDYLPKSLVDESVENTSLVAQMCDATITPKPNVPVFSKVGGARRDHERVVETCIANWHRVAHRPNQQEYIDRFEYEMGLIHDKGFCGYFLVVADYVVWAKEHGILVGPGRGSGAGCLVAYLMRITEIDPIEADLMFERFMTKGRNEPPDFDIDFPTSKRPMMEEYIRSQYGDENVVRIGSVMRYKNKGVFRVLARVLKDELDLYYPDIDKMAKIVDTFEAGEAGLGLSWDDLMLKAAEEFAPYIEKYPTLFEYAEKLVGRISTYGKHAAGYIISLDDDKLVTKLPLRNADGGLVSEWDMRDIAALGYLKSDFLYLRNLDTLQLAVDMIKEKFGITLNFYDWRDEYDDPVVWEELGKGFTLGVFQIETSGGTKMTKAMRPKSVRDLSDVIALDRPGPMKSGLDKTFMKRRNGEEEIEVVDERIAPFLTKTYGCMIYQEDIMKTCEILAGYTLEEADTVRSILGKKKREKVEQESRKFIPAAIEHGMTADKVEHLWEQMAEFAQYCFNRAHSYSYAVLGAWTAWVKFNYPLQFLVAILSTVDKTRIPEFVNEARRLGYLVMPPDINESGRGFSATDIVVRYGLDSVKGVGDKAVAEILAGQPYASFEDFMERKGKTDMGVVRKLAAVGAFDSLVPNRHSLERWLTMQEAGDLERCINKTDAVLNEWGLPCTFDWSTEPIALGKSGRPLKAKPVPKKCTKACRNYTPPTDTGFPEVESYTAAEIREREHAELGLYLSSTPFDAIDADQLVHFARGDEVETAEGGDWLIAAIVNKIKPHVDRSGKEMCFLSVYAQNMDLDVVVFSKKWKDLKSELYEGALAFFALHKNERGLSLYDWDVVPRDMMATL